MDGNLTIENASIGIDEKGLETFRDNIKTTLITDVQKTITDKFNGDVTNNIKAAWNSPNAVAIFLQQMNMDIQTLNTHLANLETQLNAAFSDAIKVFSSYDMGYSAQRRID
jgi:hypothetical protein